LRYPLGKSVKTHDCRMTIDTFIAKWAASGAAERANAQLFVAELCALLGLDPPQPKTPDESANAYVFEKTIPGAGGNRNFIDCYKRGCFVLESKQGADADTGAAPLSEAGEQRRARRCGGAGRRLRGQTHPQAQSGYPAAAGDAGRAGAGGGGGGGDVGEVRRSLDRSGWGLMDVVVCCAAPQYALSLKG
jgi:hypothetical protein